LAHGPCWPSVWDACTLLDASGIAHARLLRARLFVVSVMRSGPGWCRWQSTWFSCSLSCSGAPALRTTDHPPAHGGVCHDVLCIVWCHTRPVWSPLAGAPCVSSVCTCACLHTAHPISRLAFGLCLLWPCSSRAALCCCCRGEGVQQSALLSRMDQQCEEVRHRSFAECTMLQQWPCSRGTVARKVRDVPGGCCSSFVLS